MEGVDSQRQEHLDDVFDIAFRLAPYDPILVLLEDVLREELLFFVAL